MKKTITIKHTKCTNVRWHGESCPAYYADGQAHVWDSVAGHYTTCHSLTESQVARVRRLSYIFYSCGTAAARNLKTEKKETQMSKEKRTIANESGKRGGTGRDDGIALLPKDAQPERTKTMTREQFDNDDRTRRTP